MAQAELMILPDLSVADLNKVTNRLDAAMKESAKKAEREFGDAISRGMKRGVKGFGKAMERGYNGVGGSRGIMAGVLASVASGFGIAIARADAGTALIEGRLGEGEGRHLMQTADMLNLDAGAMASLWQRGKAAGFTDVQEFTDILANIKLKQAEAEMGTDGSLNQFKGLFGTQLFEQVFKSLGTLDNGQRMAWLDKMEAGESLGKMNAFLDNLQTEGGGTIQDQWLKLSEAQAQAGIDLLKQERLENSFMLTQQRADSERKQAELSAITESTIGAWAKEQTRVTEEHVNILKGYEANLSAAIPMRKLLEMSNTLLAQIAHNTGPKLAKDANMLQDAMNGNWDGVWWGLTGGRDFFTSQPVPKPRIGG